MLRFRQCGVRHRLRLPGFLIITIFLTMANRLTETGHRITVAVFMANGQQRDFKIKIDKTFNNHFALAGAAAFLRISPGAGQLTLLTHKALSFAGGTHDRLHQTRQTNGFCRFQEILFVIGKLIT